jgi:hypothetical protein
MGLPRHDAELHTYGDLLSWPEDIRYELIDGVAYLMSPAPARVHQKVAGELYRQIANALDGTRCRGYVAPFDVRLPKGGEADAAVDTVVQPDVLVVCDPGKLDERGMRGRPTGSSRSCPRRPPVMTRPSSSPRTSGPRSARSGWFTRQTRW